jgi:hypothetical protein
LGYLVREIRIEKHQRIFYRTFFFLFFPFHGKGVVTLFPMALTSVLKDTLFYIYILVGTRNLRALWSPPVSLNLVHVLVFFRNFFFKMCFLFLLLFCIIKIKCFFFTFIFLFIWMQVWSLEKEDTPHSFSSRVFLHYYKFFLKIILLFIWFLHFCKKNFF